MASASDKGGAEGACPAFSKDALGLSGFPEFWAFSELPGRLPAEAEPEKAPDKSMEIPREKESVL